MQCRKCGTIIKDGEKFCGICGEVITIVDSTNNQLNHQNVQNMQSANINTNQEFIQSQPSTSDWIGSNIKENPKNKGNNRKKSSVCIVIFLIIIILLLVGGIFYFLNKDKNDKNNNKNNDPQLEHNINDDGNNKANENISASDLEFLKTAKLSANLQKQKEELNKSLNNYSRETSYEGYIGQNLNPIMFKIENGNLVLYQLEKAPAMTRQNYNCEEVNCKKQVINLNNEKAKYISIDYNTWNYNINIMVLTENQNIYEDIISGENCNSLECKYDIQLKKVDTNYKFKEIMQLSPTGSSKAINYGLTVNNELISTADLRVGGNVPLLIYTYATMSPFGYRLDGKEINNPLQVAIYENGTLGIGNYDKEFINTKKFYDILKSDGKKVVAKQIFTTNSCDTFILGLDNYLYKTNLNSCSDVIKSDIKVNKHTEKQVSSIEYEVNIDASNGNIMQMTMRQMRVAVEPLNINIHYKDGTSDLFQIDRNNIGGQYYIIFED